MKVYARTNTGDPRTGFISVGDVLTRKQMEALGEVKIEELIQRGVLGVLREETAPAEEPETPAAAPDAPQGTPEEKPEEEAPEDNEEELPELDITGDMVGDAETPEAAPEPPAEEPKKGGRRNAK